MQDCETFIRGTIRFSGFSHIIQLFHDLGLTSDDKVPLNVRNLRELVESRVKNENQDERNTISSENLKKYLLPALKSLGIDASNL